MNKYLIQAAAQQASIGSNVNPPVPVDALKFEGTEEYIFFEGQSEPDYITFETI